MDKIPQTRGNIDFVLKALPLIRWEAAGFQDLKQKLIKTYPFLGNQPFLSNLGFKQLW